MRASPCGLLTTTQDGEPDEREDDGADDADDEKGRTTGGQTQMGFLVLMRSRRIVGERKKGALGNGFSGGELAGVERVVDEVVVGDEEVARGGQTEGHGATGSGGVSTGRDRGHGLGPVCGCGIGLVGHVEFDARWRSY